MGPSSLPLEGVTVKVGFTFVGTYLATHTGHYWHPCDVGSLPFWRRLCWADRHRLDIPTIKQTKLLNGIRKVALRKNEDLHDFFYCSQIFTQ